MNTTMSYFLSGEELDRIEATQTERYGRYFSSTAHRIAVWESGKTGLSAPKSRAVHPPASPALPKDDMTSRAIASALPVESGCCRRTGCERS